MVSVILGLVIHALEYAKWPWSRRAAAGASRLNNLVSINHTISPGNGSIRRL